MAGNGRRRWSVLVPVAIGAALVAVPVGAATLVTSADIVDGTIKSVDVKDGALRGADVQNGSLASADVADGSLTGRDVRNGSLTAADLAPVLRGSPATTYGSSDEDPPALDQTNPVPGDDGSYTITVTRPGDLLLVTDGLARRVRGREHHPASGLYLDDVPVPGSGGTIIGTPCVLPPCTSFTSLQLSFQAW